MRRMAFFVALGAAVACDACGGVASVETGCIDVSDTYCERLDSCNPVDMAALYGDVATCKAGAARRCHGLVGLAGLAKDGSAEETCAAAMESASCAELFLGVTPLPACAASGRGTLDAGAPCGDDYQCSAGLCFVTGGGCGACVKELALGQSGCSENFCAGVTTCDPQSDRCVALPGRGQSCKETVFCSGALLCVDGKCGDPLAKGAPCDPLLDACNALEGLTCSPTKHCEHDGTTFGTAGDRCNFTRPNGDAVLCSGAFVCTTTDPGICKARIDEGSACNQASFDSDPCVAGTRCFDGKCTLDEATCHP